MFNNMLMGAAGQSTKATGGYQVANSMLLNDGDSEQLTQTFSQAPTNQKKFTVSGWYKRTSVDTYDILFGAVGASATAGRVQVYWDNTGALIYEIYHGSGWFSIKTTQLFRDPHAWYNIMCVYDVDNSTSADKMRIYVNGSRITDFASTSYPTSSLDHLMFSNSQPTMIGNSGDNNYYDGYIAEVVGLDGQALTDMSTVGETDSNGVWRPIDPTTGNTFSGNSFYLPFTSSTLLGEDYGNGNGLVDRTSGTLTGDFTQNGGNAAAFDGNYAQASGSAARKGGGTLTAFLMKDHGSGVTRTITGFRVFGCTDQGFHSDNDSDTVEVKLQGSANGTDFTDLGTLSFTDPGDASPQGKFTGITTSTAYRYHRLLFTFDTATGGKLCGEAELYEGASPSGGNNFSASGSPTQTTDTPTDNHATFSPLLSNASKVTLSEGNMRGASSTSSGHVGLIVSNFELPTAGKYYWEWLVNTVGVTPALGWRTIEKLNPNGHSNSDDNSADFITGNDYNTGSGRILSSTIDGSTSLSQAAYGNFLTVSGGNPLANGSVLGCAYDADNGLAWFSFNNTWVDGNGTDSSSTVKGEIEAGTSGSQAFTTANGAVGEAGLHIVARSNSVSSSFNYTLRTRSDQWTGDCPSGFTALSTKNQAEAVTLTIEDGSAYHQTSTWEGDITARKITQSGFNSTFQPDWIWGKNRDNSSYSFRYFDSVRGEEKVLQTGGSSYTDAEATDSNGVTDFEADGFDIGNGVHLNGDGENIVAWQWAAGGEPTTDNIAGAGATPTAGSVKIDGSNLSSALGGTIPVTRLSANRKSGFSIGTYTGSGSNGTIATGLTTKPDMLIIKKRGDDGGNNWVTYHSSLANQGTGYVDLGTNAVEGTLANMFNSVAPGSSDATLFNVGTNTSTNDTGGSDTYVFYCFHEVPGYSKFGTFVGNSNANGPYIPLGFSASWIMIKRINIGTASWVIYDNARDPVNPANIMLLPDSTAGDNTGNKIDWLSNGVKIRGTSTAYNSTSSNNYIYMAFAENPFASTTPATAR